MRPSPLPLLAVAALLAAPAARAAQDAPRRPNVLFVFSDDHAWQAIGAYGDARALIQTPNIDRIAREGLRFDRCLVPNAICGPSRATVLTGRYSHQNGFYDNTWSRFDGAQWTFPKALQAQGYQTALVGKWHLNTDPTGFDHWTILPGQGDYYNPDFVTNGIKTRREGYVTDLITDEALAWLRGRDRKKPFLLMVHHKAPHRDWEPPLRYLESDGDRVYPEPETLFDDYAGRGPAERAQDMTIARTMTSQDLKLVTPRRLNAEQRKAWEAYYGPRNAAFEAAKLEGRELVRWRYQRYMHDYLACIRAVDEGVGRLLDALEEQGIADDTLVVYSSDQGFYLGEHGWFDKRWIFEESLRTPLLVRWPGHVAPGGVNKDMVSTLDFAPTFLEAAGLKAPAGVVGASLVPFLEGRRPDAWRTSFYYHYYEFPGPHDVARHYGVVTDRYKLVRFYELGDGAWELYDLQKDPHELKSVYGDEAYRDVRAELTKELARLRKELAVPDPDPEVTRRPAPRAAPEEPAPK